MKLLKFMFEHMCARSKLNLILVKVSCLILKLEKNRKRKKIIFTLFVYFTLIMIIFMFWFVFYLFGFILKNIHNTRDRPINKVISKKGSMMPYWATTVHLRLLTKLQSCTVLLTWGFVCLLFIYKYAHKSWMY